MGRLYLAVLASVIALVAAPTAASACASPTHVKSFHGHVRLSFDANNSGSDSANGGTYSAQLTRSLTSLSVNLTHKTVLRGGHVIFSGRVHGGSASVHDTYNDTGTGASGQEQHSGPLTNSFPSFGRATLYFDANACKYQLIVSFAVETKVSGSRDAGSRVAVTGTGYSAREHIPKHLHVAGGDAPNAYGGGGCPGNPLKTGNPCYRWGSGLIGLCNTSDMSASQCPTASDPVGNTTFIWSILPKF